MDAATHAKEEEARRVFKARKTTLEMLSDRGYHIPKESRIQMEHFLELHGTDLRREDLTEVFHKAEDHTAQIFVYFAEDEKVNVATVKALYEKMKSENATRAIMIVHGKLSPFVKNALSQMEDGHGVRVEVFQEQELLINITKHVLVPEHRVLMQEEKDDLLKQYKLNEFQLPRILVTDPVARYYGMTRGQVVRIVRPSETAGRYVTYRRAT